MRIFPANSAGGFLNHGRDHFHAIPLGSVIQPAQPALLVNGLEALQHGILLDARGIIIIRQQNKNTDSSNKRGL
jgi:hypothetical protein